MVSVRTAHIADLAALCRLRYADQRAIHRDRIRATDNQTYSYLVVEQEDALVGFGVLLLGRPPQWTDPLNSFPIAVDLFVAEHHRSQGIGRTLLEYMESMAREHEKTALYLTVEPVANPRALALYQRLGFQPLQQEPYHNVWRFTDSEGIERIGEEWVIDMWKPLTTNSPK
jgi:GNAT superfamily N-acetyltransferase